MIRGSLRQSTSAPSSHHPSGMEHGRAAPGGGAGPGEGPERGFAGPSPPDVTGWPLPDAERMLALAGARWTVRQTAWVGRLPAETGPRPEGMPRVLAQRPRGPLDVELVVARFVYDARGRATVGGSAADGRRATAQQGG